MAERTAREIRKQFPEQSEPLLRKIHASLNEWRTTGKRSGVFDGIRQSFDTLQASAQAAGYPDISRLSHAVTRLMNQYGGASDYDSERVLINLLEEMHDGLAAVARMPPADAESYLRPLTGIVESLLPASQTGGPDAPDQSPETDAPGQLSEPDTSGQNLDQQKRNRSCATRTADDSCINENRKFSYLLDFSRELGSTRNRLGNTVEQMRRDLTTLKYSINQIRVSIQIMDSEHDEGLTASARKINLQLDTLAQVERKLRERISVFAGSLIQQSHYGERLQAGLIKAGMVRETMTLCRVLLVRVGAWRFAIRAATIERAMRVTDEEISVVDGHRTVQTDDGAVPVVDLAGEIRKSGAAIESSRHSLILIRSGNRVSAFEVEQFEGTTEVAISASGTQLASVRGITGVTVLADGCIIPVLDPAEFPGHPIVRELISNTPA